MKPNVVYVWSTGLESWEETDISDEELISFTFLHSKVMGMTTLYVYQDSLGRMFGHTFKDSNAQISFCSDGYCHDVSCV